MGKFFICLAGGLMFWKIIELQHQLEAQVCENLTLKAILKEKDDGHQLH